MLFIRAAVAGPCCTKRDRGSAVQWCMQGVSVYSGSEAPSPVGSAFPWRACTSGMHESDQLVLLQSCWVHASLHVGCPPVTPPSALRAILLHCAQWAPSDGACCRAQHHVRRGHRERVVRVVPRARRAKVGVPPDAAAHRHPRAAAPTRRGRAQRGAVARARGRRGAAPRRPEGCARPAARAALVSGQARQARQGHRAVHCGTVCCRGEAAM